MSQKLTFVILSGLIFGLASAGTLWANDQSPLVMLLAYMVGGNVGMYLAAALAYFQNTPD
ncbi:MAG: hypothetical protein AAGA28_15400 [Pseudomonadota bacterium]